MDSAELKQLINVLIDKYLDEAVRNKNQKDAADELTRLAQIFSNESGLKIAKTRSTLDLIEYEATGTPAWPIVSSVTERIRKTLDEN
jgi:hypothetical protein